MTVPATPQTPKQALTAKRKKLFLQILAQTGKVVTAARAVGYKESVQLRKWYNEDSDFAAEWDAAVEAAADKLEDVLIDRAVDGVSKPILYKGQIVAEEVTYSDTLLLEAVRASNRRYRKSAQTEIEVNVNAKVGIAMIPMKAADAVEWEKQAAQVHTQQKKLPSFTSADGSPIQDAEFTEVSAEGKAEPVATPKQMTIERA